MKHISVGLLAASALFCGVANAAVQVLSIEGEYSAVGGALIDPGDVSGQLSYDDAADVGGVGPLGAFELHSLLFELSGGLSFSLADDPFARAITNRATGEIVELEFFATGLSGFGLSDLNAASDLGVLSFFVFDGASAVVVEGTFSIAPVPLPAVGLAFPLVLSGAIWLRHRRT